MKRHLNSLFCLAVLSAAAVATVTAATVDKAFDAMLTLKKRLPGLLLSVFAGPALARRPRDAFPQPVAQDLDNASRLRASRHEPSPRVTPRWRLCPSV